MKSLYYISRRSQPENKKSFGWLITAKVYSERMISLEETFVSGDGGFSQEPLTYRQIKRTDKVAIYERSRNGKVKDYEVILIKVEPKGKVMKFPNGVVKILEDDREKYPSTGQFGFSGWSFNWSIAAERRYEKLCKEANLPLEEEEEAKVISIPLGEFTIKELAEKNELPYSQAFLFIKAGIEDKSINFLREERRAAKGKPSKVFVKSAWHIQWPLV